MNGFVAEGLKLVHSSLSRCSIGVDYGLFES